ncbi:MAG TPA: MOSC N-terminal beta barrel domain-containing protein [Pseudolysinimonas sp.]|nr:MOSC N-terminal beta barrel domain-containing protein [Pseudolysinimonas sp.]
MITLAGLRRYPVKSTRGHDLESALVERWGLAGDRRWMIVDDAGEQVTAREHHRLLTVLPEPIPGGLRLTAPGIAPLEVAEPGTAQPGIPGHVPVSIWDDPVDASPADPAADSWLSSIVGRPVRLVFLDDPTRRAIDRAGHPASAGDVVTFADAYPMLLASLSSLQQLNSWIGEAGADQTRATLDIRRFRPNLVIDGAEPFAEDTWSRIRVGDTVFRVAGDCSRCVLTTVDPDTIERGHEPIRTLARHRRWDGKVWFAVNLIPEEPGGTLRVGDPVEVLEANRPARMDPARPAA